jgi:hypothetical protein
VKLSLKNEKERRLGKVRNRLVESRDPLSKSNDRTWKAVYHSSNRSDYCGCSRPGNCRKAPFCCLFRAPEDRRPFWVKTGKARCEHLCNVVVMSEKCQTRKSPGSFNHLVGEQLKGVGHREAEGRGGLEINDEFVFERELNWQIARICASQNLVHV